MPRRGASCLRSPLLVAMLLLAAGGRAHADGGVLVLDARGGPFLITAFAAPAPLRAGPVDLSVLVRDGSSGQPLLDAEVRLELEQVGAGHDEPPADQHAPDAHVGHLGDEGAGDGQAGHAMGGDAGAHVGHGPRPAVLRVLATREQATNKLLRAALVELPAEGSWRLTVRVTRDGATGVAGTTLELGPPLPAWISRWKALALPPVVVALFLANQLLGRRRRRAARVATRPSRSSARSP